MPSEDKTKTRLLRRMGEAVADFAMIEDGDRILVCISGGKDSHTMLDLLLDWAPDDATRKMILVDNPAELYKF